MNICFICLTIVKSGGSHEQTCFFRKVWAMIFLRKYNSMILHWTQIKNIYPCKAAFHWIQTKKKFLSKKRHSIEFRQKRYFSVKSSIPFNSDKKIFLSEKWNSIEFRQKIQKIEFRRKYLSLKSGIPLNSDKKDISQWKAVFHWIQTNKGYIISTSLHFKIFQTDTPTEKYKILCENLRKMQMKHVLGKWEKWSQCTNKHCVKHKHLLLLCFHLSKNSMKSRFGFEC